MHTHTHACVHRVESRQEWSNKFQPHVGNRRTISRFAPEKHLVLWMMTNICCIMPVVAPIRQSLHHTTQKRKESKVQQHICLGCWPKLLGKRWHPFLRLKLEGKKMAPVFGLFRLQSSSQLHARAPELQWHVDPQQKAQQSARVVSHCDVWRPL